MCGAVNGVHEPLLIESRVATLAHLSERRVPGGLLTGINTWTVGAAYRVTLFCLQVVMR